jgi:molecular chaperone DnaK (HSP70)
MHAVALGAAVQAHMLEEGNQLDQVVVTDVSPFTLGVSVVGEYGGQSRPGVFDPLIHRNSTLPARATKIFSTCHPEQESVAIEVYQGDDSLVENNVFLERYYLGGFPTRTGQPQALEISFQYDVDGILQVTAVVKSTGKSAGIRIDPSKMSCVGQGLIAARGRVDSLWERARESRQLRTLIEKIRQRLHEVEEPRRGSLEEKLLAAKQALEAGDRPAIARLTDELRSSGLEGLP